MSNSINKLHKELNPYFKSKQNPNWKALVEAIGEMDDEIGTLIEEVRKQFFIQTAERPYIDRIAANLNIQRPRVVGMGDADFRKYVPIIAYQPKQVKLIFDKLIDIFFFKEATTAFAQSIAPEYYLMEDGWELIYEIDGINNEQIIFKSEDFTNISAATAEEVASAINRQARFSFAIAFDDRIEKRKYVRIFTNTVGSKGSIKINGGRANIALKFGGTLIESGSGSTTQWLVNKIGSDTTFQWVGGDSPGLSFVQVGDNVVIDMPGNSGTFSILSVDISNNSFSFENIFSTPGSFDQSLIPNSYVSFIRPLKSIVWNKSNRACVWEVSPGEVVVEMPATPPVVKRELKGSAHLNGLVSEMIARPSDTSITLSDASDWPTAGVFVLEPRETVDMHILTGSSDFNDSVAIDGRFDIKNMRYSYSSKSGNSLIGITPSLPRKSEISEISITSISRTSDVTSVSTTFPHLLKIGQSVAIIDTADSSFNGTFVVSDIIDENSFNYVNYGLNATTTGGYIRSEFIGLAESGSKVYLTTAKVNTGVFGPYVWDASSAFVLSSYTGVTITDIKAGNILLNIQVQTPNNIPFEQGFLIFDYGLETQEGPVRYLYKASDSVISIDPSYVFKFDHAPGSSITAIRRKGGHVLSGIGTEYPFYISDPSAARLILQDLVASIKSVGVFLKFIVRYPELYYATIDTYQVGIDPG